MENCLVTKLKGSVENNDLPHFGGFTVQFYNAVVGTDYVRVADVNNPIEVYAKSGTFGINGESGLTYYKTPTTGGWNILPEQNNTKIEIISKYGIQSLALFGSGTPDSANVKKYVDFEELAYGDFVLFGGRIVPIGELNIEQLPKMATAASAIDYYVEQGRPSKFIVPTAFRFPSSFTKFSVNAANAVLQDKTGEDVVLDLQSLEDCVNLKMISIGNVTTVTGDIDALCDTLHSKGKTSGNLFVGLPNTSCIRGNKPEGEQAITQAYTVTFTTEGWTADID